MKRGLFIGAIAFLSVAIGAWYFGSPYLAMSGLRSAALEGDRSVLSERIDFPAIRESLKGQMTAVMMAEAGKQDSGGGMGALGAMLAVGFVNQMVDGLVTPDGMRMMIERGRLAKLGDDQLAEEVQAPEWQVERTGFSSFKATPIIDKPEKTPPSLIFRRDGLSWKLVDIEIPRDLLSSPAQSASGGI